MRKSKFFSPLQHFLCPGCILSRTAKMPENERNVLIMKKLIVCVVCLLLVLLSMAACGGKAEEPLIGGDPRTWGPAETTEAVQIPNPWTDCTSLEEAGKLAGFSFTAPDALEGYPEKYIGAIENEIAEVIFNDEDGAEICFRKGVGTEDISGDYNVYKTTETQTIDGKTLTCKGNDGLVSNAIWTDGTYAYSIMSTVGMTAEQLSTFVQSLS